VPPRTNDLLHKGPAVRAIACQSLFLSSIGRRADCSGMPTQQTITVDTPLAAGASCTLSDTQNRI